MTYLFFTGCGIAVIPTIFLHRFDGMSLLGFIFMAVSGFVIIARQTR